MSPWVLLLWVLAAGLAIVIVAVVALLVVSVVKQMVVVVKGKGSGDR
ncbi:hypothetical protein [Humibacter sp. RRB41]|nr:hypothetical protein [Humibacter sp. RRB41]